jgi:hypothetical protein
MDEQQQQSDLTALENEDEFEEFEVEGAWTLSYVQQTCSQSMAAAVALFMV